MSSAQDHDPSPALYLKSADFDAYLPERASSNAFNRPRLELKQRMLAWAPAVVARLAELGVMVDVSGSDEHPNLRNGRRVDCQRVFFWRDADARADLERLIDRKRSLAARLGDPAPHKSHAYLALKVDAARVEVSIEVYPEAWVDTRNLLARLAQPERVLELAAVLEALPEQFTIGAVSTVQAVQASTPRAGVDALRAALAACDADGTPVVIGWTVTREVAVDHSELLDEQLEDALVALGPLYKLVAWSKDNDLLVLDRERDAARQERELAHEQVERQQAEWEERRDVERRAKLREREERLERDELTRSIEPISVELPRVEGPAGFVPQPKRAMVRRAVAPRVTDVDPSVAIEKGTRVQVLEGPFAGKVGVVQDLDGKGGARVLLGLLAMKLDVKDLIASAEGTNRPALASSHRKPAAARS